jgi:two-component system chemotaxis response regulator CheY
MKTCLIVEDSSIVRKMARRILEGLGFDVVEAEDGVDALVVCKRAMPGDFARLEHAGDGHYHFMCHLRRMPGGDEPKIVFARPKMASILSSALDGGNYIDRSTRTLLRRSSGSRPDRALRMSLV